MLYFSEQVVKVNGSGILAENASLSYDSPQEIIQGIGFKGRGAVSFAGPTQFGLSVSYAVQTNHEPIYQLVKHLKDAHSTFNYPAIPIEVGNISGGFYLNSVSYRVVSNDIVRATATFTAFEVTTDNAYNKNGFEGSNVGYGLYSYAGLDNGITNRVFDFNYEFRAQWAPLYILGRKTPNQVQLMSAQEEFSFTQESWRHPSYTGNNYPDVTGIVIKGTGSAALVFPLSSGRIDGMTLNASLDDIGRITTTVVQIY